MLWRGYWKKKQSAAGTWRTFRVLGRFWNVRIFLRSAQAANNIIWWVGKYDTGGASRSAGSHDVRDTCREIGSSLPICATTDIFLPEFFWERKVSSLGDPWWADANLTHCWELFSPLLAGIWEDNSTPRHATSGETSASGGLWQGKERRICVARDAYLKQTGRSESSQKGKAVCGMNWEDNSVGNELNASARV